MKPHNKDTLIFCMRFTMYLHSNVTGNKVIVIVNFRKNIPRYFHGGGESFNVLAEGTYCACAEKGINSEDPFTLANYGHYMQ